MSMAHAIGYAIKVGDQINVRSVGPHSRSAMINWLMTDCHVPLSNAMTNPEIRAIFDHYAKRGLASCVKVSIEEVQKLMSSDP